MKIRYPQAFFWTPFHSWLLLALTAAACLMSGCVSSKTARLRAEESAQAQAMMDQYECRAAIDELNDLWVEQYCKMLFGREVTIAGLRGSSSFKMPKVCAKFMKAPDPAKLSKPGDKK